MMTLVRRNGGSTYRDPFALAREVFGFDPLGAVDWSPARTADDGFLPAFEVAERSDAYYFTADLPGVKEADLEVTVHEGQLIVSGNREAEARQDGDNFFVYERRYGDFKRAFKLPDDADDSSIEASLEGGVLEVRVAKREAMKPRKISLGQRLREKLGKS